MISYIQEQEEELLRLCSRPSLDQTDLARLLHLIKEDKVAINSQRHKTFETPLMCLCRYNMSESLLPTLKAMLEREDLDLTLKDLTSHNALTVLFRYNQHHTVIDCARLLISRGIDCTNQDKLQRTALHLVCKFFKGKGMLPCVQLLVEQDIAVTIIDNKGRTALYHLCKNYKEDNFIEVARLLIDCFMDGKELTDCKAILHQRKFHSDAFVQLIRSLGCNGLEEEVDDDDLSTEEDEDSSVSESDASDAQEEEKNVSGILFFLLKTIYSVKLKLQLYF